MEELEEMKSRLRKQVERLEELRMKQVQEPGIERLHLFICADELILGGRFSQDAFYGLDDDPALRDVDVMTDVSMAPTTFTRYTQAPSTASRTSKYA